MTERSDDQDMMRALAAACDQVRDGIGEPVWTPLELLLPSEEWGGWMFMAAKKSRCLDYAGYRDQIVFSYKHGITRHYLHIGEDMRCYRYMARVNGPHTCYQLLDTDTAINAAYEGLELLNATRGTAYSPDYIAARNARLRELGFNVVS